MKGRERVGGGEKIALIIFLIPPKHMEWMGSASGGGRCEWMGLMRVDEEMRGGGAGAPIF